MTKLVVTACLIVLPMVLLNEVYGQGGMKLFSSPQVRAELERRRLGLVEVAPEPTIDLFAILNEPEIESELVYSLSGTLLKEDGTSIVWLNGQAVPEADLPLGVSVVKPASKGELRITANDRDFFLKPGQVLNVTTGVLFEAYQWDVVVAQKRLEEIARQAADAATSVESPVAGLSNTP